MSTIGLLCELGSLRNGYLFLDGGYQLTRSELQWPISLTVFAAVHASYFFLLFFLCILRVRVP